MSRRVIGADDPSWIVLRRPLADGLDLGRVFPELFTSPGRRVWLDSSATGSGSGRFSFIGEASEPAGALLEYDVGDAGVWLRRFDGRAARSVPGDLFEVLAGVLQDAAVTADSHFPFVGGLVGWFGYELKGELGMPGPHRAATPDAAWLFIDRVVALDHVTGEAAALALVRDDARGRAAGRTWLDDVAVRCASSCSSRRQEADPVAGSRAQMSLPALEGEPVPEPVHERGREQYLGDVRACQDALRAGCSYEICLTNTSSLPFTGDSFELYLALRQANPAPYSSFLDIGRVQVVSASPERFLHLDATGLLETRPIKGTAARHCDPVADAAAAASLAADEKTVAENVVVVDLLRNDLHRVCVPGTVTTSALLDVESYPRMHQLVSTVQGRLRDDLGPLDAVRACFPGGSMTGAPKRRTCEILDDLEAGPRGIYSGSAGYLSASGTADLAIVIRTAVVHEGRAGVGAGGGIVLDSDPLSEYDEMRLKAESTLSVIRSVSARAGVRAGR